MKILIAVILLTVSNLANGIPNCKSEAFFEKNLKIQSREHPVMIGVSDDHTKRYTVYISTDPEKPTWSIVATRLMFDIATGQPHPCSVVLDYGPMFQEINSYEMNEFVSKEIKKEDWIMQYRHPATNKPVCTHPTAFTYNIKKGYNEDLLYTLHSKEKTILVFHSDDSWTIAPYKVTDLSQYGFLTQDYCMGPPVSGSQSALGLTYAEIENSR